MRLNRKYEVTSVALTLFLRDMMAEETATPQTEERRPCPPGAHHQWVRRVKHKPNNQQTGNSQ